MSCILVFNLHRVGFIVHWCWCRTFCDAPEGTSWAQQSPVATPMCLTAPDDPSGLHNALWWRSSSPLNLLWTVQLLQGGVMWLRWEVKSQHSSSERLIKWCLHLSLWSWPLGWTSREGWKMRRGVQHMLQILLFISACFREDLSNSRQNLVMLTICIIPQQPLWKVSISCTSDRPQLVVLKMFSQGWEWHLTKSYLFA